MNVKLLRRIQKHILAEPRRLDMEVVGREQSELRPNQRPPCGTTGCIAGWAIVLGMRRKFIAKDDLLVDRKGNSFGAEEASELLDIGGFFEDPSRNLFFVDNWPEEFRDSYSRADSKGRAAVTAKRIDHFIKTKGAE